MKVLVFGYGSMGRRHVEHALILGHQIGIHDPYRGHEGEAPMVRWLPTERLAWAWTPDAVVIATPADTHARLAFDATARGLPTLVEKPLGLSAQEFDDWPRTQKNLVTVGYNWRWHLLPVTLYDTMEREGVEPTSAYYWMFCDMTTWPGQRYADILLEGSHEIDLALCALGPGSLERIERKTTDWKLHLRHASGAQSTVWLDSYASVPARGCVMFDREHHVGGYTVPYQDPREAQVLALSYKAELATFLDSAEQHRPAQKCATFEDGLAVLRICDRARVLAQQAIP